MGDPDGPVPELASAPVDGTRSSRPRVRRARGPHAARKPQRRSFMRRHLVAAGTFTLLLATATGVAVADDDEHDDRSSGFRPVVVADGLDNPRQLDLAGDKLLIAEAGRGGNDCVAPPSTETPTPTTPTDTTSATPTTTDSTSATPTTTDSTSATPTTTGSTTAPVAATTTTSPTPSPTDTTSPTPTGTTSLTPTDTTSPTPTDTTTLPPSDTTTLPPPDTTTPPARGGEACAGFAGAMAAIKEPANDDNRKAERLVDGLFSVATADGTIGSDGVAATGSKRVLLIAEGEPTPDALRQSGVAGPETQEHLLVSVDGKVTPWVDLGAEEKSQNPDGKTALDSNPNQVIVVDPTSDDDDHDDSDRGHDRYALVADAGANAVWKVTADFSHLDENDLPKATVSVFAAYEADNDPATPEFVPSSLARDDKGNIYVGGVGSLVP